MLTYIRPFLQYELFHGCSDDYARKRFFHNASMYKSSASCSVAPFVFVTPTGVVEDLPQCSCIRFLCSVAPFMSVTPTGMVEAF